MARASIDTHHIPARTTTTVTLELSEAEVSMLRVILAKIGGHPGSSPRAHAESISYALSDAGVPDFTTVPEYRLLNPGPGLFFSDYPNEV